MVSLGKQSAFSFLLTQMMNARLNKKPKLVFKGFLTTCGGGKRPILGGQTHIWNEAVTHSHVTSAAHSDCTVAV